MREEIFYELLPGISHPEVKCFILIERKSGFYVMNILVPTFMIIGVALGVFWIEPDSGEKINLSVTVLLAFSVLQLLVAEHLPMNSDYTPILGD